MRRLFLSLAILAFASATADAGPIRDRIAQRRAQHQQAKTAPKSAPPTAQFAAPKVATSAAPIFTLPASGGCANGKCALPRR